jgi:branched-chain amino acid transport system permease protein
MELRKVRVDRTIKARTEDIFALMSFREMAYLLTPRVILVLGLLALPLVLGAYWQRVLISAAAFALLALSWDLLVSTGMVCLGQGLFFGVGAYVAGILNYSLKWPPLVTIPIATVGGGMICTLLLLPVLRLRGIYFAMVTLALPLMLVRIIEATKILGGTEGLSGITPLPSTKVEVYLSLTVVLVVLFFFRRLINSNYGLVLRGIRDNDRSVLSTGINIYWYKTQALFLASAVGAFAGALITHTYMFVGMPVFELDYSILPIASVVVGGMGTFVGSLLGAFILVPLSEILRGLGGLRTVVYGLFLVIFIVALPAGIFHYIQRKYHQVERWVKVGE